MSENHLLTKSTFMRALQCSKSLMLDVLQPELRDPIEPHVQMLMQQGQQVGMLARKCFPGGQIGRIPGAIDPSLERTRELIQGGSMVLYEPAFSYSGVFILADILIKRQNRWSLIEVKSTTHVKPEHHWDLAVQLFVLRGKGMEIGDVSLLHINNEYVRQGELDLGSLFTEVSLFTDLEALQQEVHSVVSSAKNLLALGEMPERAIGSHCTDPNRCDFMGDCWSHLPQPSVFDVYRLAAIKKHSLYREGIVRMEDIPESFSMPASSRFHVDAHRAGKEILNRGALADFLSELIFPLYFLDFETISSPIPPFDGVKPYAHVPFQYSLHVQTQPGVEPEHSGFLATAGSDWRVEFIDHLLQSTEGPGDIVVYNISFERGVLKGLAEQFPEYSAALHQRIERLVDLMEPFRQRMYWIPEMGGSVSLKSVLPALVPELSYDVLEVKDGTQAMQVFFSLEDLGDAGSAEPLRQALWDYCKLDTLAMLRVLEALYRIAELG